MASASFIPIVVHDVSWFDFKHQGTHWLCIIYTYEVTEYFCYCEEYSSSQTFLFTMFILSNKTNLGLLGSCGYREQSNIFSGPVYNPFPFSPIFLSFHTLILLYLFVNSPLLPHKHSCTLLSFLCYFLCPQQDKGF